MEIYLHMLALSNMFYIQNPLNSKLMCAMHAPTSPSPPRNFLGEILIGYTDLPYNVLKAHYYVRVYVTIALLFTDLLAVDTNTKCFKC